MSDESSIAKTLDDYINDELDQMDWEYSFNESEALDEDYDDYDDDEECLCDEDDCECQDYDSDDCSICGWVGLESHYHCSECGGLCSMMGHLDIRDTTKYTCDPVVLAAWKIRNPSRSN